ncbi:family 2B encapsulin nanocompartment shell protein [Herbidospora daliensis]|uniref:family 2B encapsulin nanocompartment shell protein n=1 Tax=Herbidospora daliensis TaxID=295585 RepID=UPI00078135ED|nr:family 2B encapsulin nanocompartment shell protein [Herbidospora daliensis]
MTVENEQLSLGTAAARKLATTTKTVPQMQGISSRWLLKVLPWVQVSGGAYRVNRRLSYAVGDGRVTFTVQSGQVRVIPAELTELPLLRGFDDPDTLTTLSERFTQRDFSAGDVIVEAGQPADQVILVAHGKLTKIGTGPYGDQVALGLLADGDHIGDQTLLASGTWDYTVKATTAGTVLTLPRSEFERLVDQSDTLRAHVESYQAGSGRPQDEYGEAAIEVSSGHHGEPSLPGTFVDYETSPREYELSVAQTVLRVHSRVADLYNDPMDQIEQQLRLTIEALRERQEHEIVNNREFGLLANADLKQRTHTRSGPPTPDDVDELLSLVWREPSYILAHPLAIAAFGRECSARGVYPTSVDVGGHHFPSWRGVPILPCNKIPVTDTRTSSMIVMRLGEEKQGVVGLHQVGIPDEYQPSLSVRFMGIDEKAIIKYLVSAYYSAAILVPDALGILENVEVGH